MRLRNLKLMRVKYGKISLTPSVVCCCYGTTSRTKLSNVTRKEIPLLYRNQRKTLEVGPRVRGRASSGGRLRHANAFGL